jgi:hypothetical protein
LEGLSTIQNSLTLVVNLWSASTPITTGCATPGESGDHFLAEDLDDTLANTVKTPGVSTKGFIGPLDHSLEITLGGGAPTCCGEFGDEALTAVPQVEMHATGKPATHVWDDLPSAKGNQCAMTR